MIHKRNKWNKWNKLNKLNKLNRSMDWVLVPSTPKEIEAARKKCRRMVMRRAAISAGVSIVPIPGLDIALDAGMLAGLIDDINAEFGLSEQQISRLHPKLQWIAYELIAGMSGKLIGKVIKRRMLAKFSTKFVPVAGQAASAAIGFAVFRAIGYQHIESCVAIAGKLAKNDAA